MSIFSTQYKEKKRPGGCHRYVIGTRPFHMFFNR
jgi:hypothetical protein